MQLNHFGSQLLLLSVIVASAACSRAPAPTPPPPPVEPTVTTFAITATQTVVTADQLPEDGQAPIVRADFNSDTLEDVAVAEKDAEGLSIVSIYLQKLGTGTSREFYRAGGIRQAGDYAISALMSSAHEGHADLLVICKYADGSKEMVHYRSNGESFDEIMRKPIGTAPPADQPPAP